ncbi:MAG: MurR/RpiR family transcriptional regulator [Canibacter sp.]
MNLSNPESPRVKITAVGDQLTTSERRVVMTLLSNYPEAGLRTVASFAELAKVSPPTIIRFVRKLGYEHYSGFQDALRRELGDFKVSPAQLLTRDEDIPGPALSNPFEGFELLDAELNGAAQILANPKASVFSLGGIWSQPAAHHFTNSMQRVRSNCFTLTNETLPPAIVDAGKNTVFVVFDFRQYTPELFAGMRLGHDRSATVILVTDRWVSPIAAISKIMLPVEIEHPPFDSLIAPIALSEVLTERVRHHLGHEQDARIKELYRVYEAVGALPQ